MNQLLDSKLTEDNDEEEKGGKATKKQENDAMVLWDCVSLFDTEENTLKHEEISETNMSARSLDLVNKDNSILSKIKKLQENVKTQPKNNIDDETPKITSQDLKQVNMPTKPIEEENLKTPEELG